MACTIVFNNLLNGQKIPLPFEVNGRITVLPTPPNGHIIAAARQIDDNPLIDIKDNCTPAPGPAVGGPIDFSLTLTSSDCPAVDQYYMLTVYAWDDVSAPVSVASVTFKTVDLLGGGDPPKFKQGPPDQAPPDPGDDGSGRTP
jgi:hypothetical protein